MEQIEDDDGIKVFVLPEAVGLPSNLLFDAADEINNTV